MFKEEGYQLMEAAFRNVNALSGVAMMPAPGSHLFELAGVLTSHLPTD